MKYNLVRDGDGWGVVDETDTLINTDPMSRLEAIELRDECNNPDESREYQMGYAYACGYYT